VARPAFPVIRDLIVNRSAFDRIIQAEGFISAPTGSVPNANAVLVPKENGIDRQEAPLGTQFYRQTIPTFQISLNLNYTIFDFGARRGRINVERARLLAAKFTFNDVHRQLIYAVSNAYYRLINAAGQEEAAGANLVNAQNVQHAAEERLRNGLATLSDVLDARSATARAQYDLRAVLGAEQIAQGDLLTALGAPARTPIRVQSLNEASTLESASETIEEAIQRALAQRPGLQAQAAEIRVAQAERQQAGAAFYPNLNIAASPSAQSLYLGQQTLPWGHTAGFTGAAAFSLNWTVFDGGARVSLDPSVPGTAARKPTLHHDLRYLLREGNHK
jgi:outer membrane protein